MSTDVFLIRTYGRGQFAGRRRSIATPHSAWYSETAITTLQRKAAEEVVNVLQGNEPFHCVNRQYLQ